MQERQVDRGIEAQSFENGVVKYGSYEQLKMSDEESLKFENGEDSPETKYMQSP